MMTMTTDLIDQFVKCRHPYALELELFGRVRMAFLSQTTSYGTEPRLLIQVMRVVDTTLPKGEKDTRTYDIGGLVDVSATTCVAIRP